MKVKIHFKEKNKRLLIEKTQVKTIEIPTKNPFDVDSVIDAVKDDIKSSCYEDSTVTLLSYKIGLRTFSIRQII